MVWLDLLDPDEPDLGIVTQEFGLHPLAVEDAALDHEHPKLDRYRSHPLLNLYAAEVPGSPAIKTTELSAFITRRALITVRKGPFEIDALVRQWDFTPQLVDGGVGFLVYGLLSAWLRLAQARLRVAAATGRHGGAVEPMHDVGTRLGRTARIQDVRPFGQQTTRTRSEESPAGLSGGAAPPQMPSRRKLATPLTVGAESDR